ncbi:hypothetical protein KYK29_15590 [Shinella daejeonensis]|uniref:hypothetical protein n=1 Tax=Shinella daejeonensis TaxID=659017 RepID=UPI0020C788BF|nr:hypothetical protein [Shinella daejeonensis]MCP8896350.1 hypothetical protein [Shinella daejeonensis]
MADDTEEQPNYDDGRTVGNWTSRYKAEAWWQIGIEFVLLLSYLLVANFLMLQAILVQPDTAVKSGFIYLSPLDAYVAEANLKWMALALAGFVGGAVFDLKWLYHSVAKGIWNRDRCLWRIIVPFNSSMVSLFTGFLFASGIIPFLKNESFDDIYALLGFGFVFGYFSDNILAALQNLAKQIFGTLNDG